MLLFPSDDRPSAQAKGLAALEEIASEHERDGIQPYANELFEKGLAKTQRLADRVRRLGSPV